MQQAALRRPAVGLEGERLLKSGGRRGVAARFLLEIAERAVNVRRVAAELEGSREVDARVVVSLGSKVQHAERLVRAHVIRHRSKRKVANRSKTKRATATRKRALSIKRKRKAKRAPR